MAITPEDKVIKVLKDLPLFAKNFLKITDKDGNIINFEFNRAQRYVHDRVEDQIKRIGRVRLLILKGRQQGISTYISARFFHRVVTSKGIQAFILTHMGDATKSLFEMTKRFNKFLPEGLIPKPSKDNDNRLVFDTLNSGYRVGTAGSKEIGRSMTNQVMHLSEYAFYENHAEIKKGIEQTVADNPGTEKFKESTANGISNAFYMDWMRAKEGESDWETVFVPWYWQDEYTRDSANLKLSDEEKDWMALYELDGLTVRHLAWRRYKLADFAGDPEQKAKGFKQEYPFNDEEAFLNSITDTFITVEPIARARKAEVDSESPLIIGVDPARGGEDFSAVTRRRGRKAYKQEKFKGLTTMQLAGRLKTMIDSECPSKMFIDCIGIGAGVVDRLQEMGYQCVVGVNVARSANNNDQFLNLRAELWSEMRDWLNGEMPVQIPDCPDLQKELCGLGYAHNSQGRLVIESKEKARARGMHSPDLADSLMITFAFGMHASETSYQPNYLPEHTAGMFT